MKFVAKITAFILLVAILSAGLPVMAAEYKIDSTGIPGWEITNYEVDAEYYVDGGTRASGNGALKLVNKTKVGGFLEALTKVDGMKNGKTYTLEFDAKIKNGVAMVTFNNATRYSLVPLGNTYDWTHFKFDYKTDRSSGNTISFLLQGGATEAFWVDNVQLYEKADKSKTNLIKKGNFEEGIKSGSASTAVKEKPIAKELYIVKKDIEIDGELTDWSEIEPIEITRVQSFVKTEIAPVLEGNIRFAYDDNNFYFAIEVIDDKHYALGSDSYWEDDGVQFALATLSDSNGQEFGITYSEDTDKTNLFGAGVNAKCVRNGNKYVYETALPWNVKFSGGKPEAFLFNALVNDNDGDGRKYCIEMAPGISAGKSLAEYKKILCLESFGDIGWFADIPNEYVKDIQQTGKLLLQNNSANTKEISIKSDILKLNKNIKLAPFTVETTELDFVCENYDGILLDISLSCEGEDFVIERKINCRYTDKDFSYIYEKISGYKKELAELLFKCDKKGFATDYEVLNYSVIDKFLSYMEDEAAHNDFSRLNRYHDVLTELYVEAKQNMTAYLKGEKVPLRVPKYVSGDVKLDGVGVRAMTFDGKEEKETPVFFVGYGHWDTPREEIPFFTSIGTNIIQAQGLGSIKKAEAGRPLPENPTELDLIAAENGWYIDYSGFEKMKADLKRAVENNVLVSVNFGIGGVPSFVSDGDPTVNQGGGQFVTFNVDHPKVRNYVGLVARVVASELKDCEGLFDICITNEPSVRTFNSSYFESKWQEHIRKKYGTLEKLNEVYESNYASFTEVTMPQELERTQRFYDWMRFNDSYFADFHNWLAKIMQEEAPNIRIQCKVMDYFDYYYYEDLRLGTDYEKIADTMDVNGCDAFAYYDIGQQPLQLKMGWYDLMTSMKKAPVWNTEDHLIRDLYNVDYNDMINPYTSADIWNGAVHGRGASVIWIWDKGDASMPWGAESGWVEKFQSSNFVLRPKEVAAIGKTTLDLNRLGEEITAIQKKDTDVGILYSRTSLAYNKDCMSVTGKAYESVLYNGQKVGFVTDTKPADMHKYKILIVPATTNVSKEIIDNIRNFVSNGGKLLIADENSLKYDEYNKEHNPEVIDEIYSRAVIAEVGVEKALEAMLCDMGLNEVVLVDAESGEKVSLTEWSYAEYNGKIVVNVLNYEWGKDKDVKILYNGKEIEKFKELRSNENYETTIKLNALKPILIEFSK